MAVRVDEVVTEASVIPEPPGRAPAAPSRGADPGDDVRRAIEQARRDALRVASEGYDD